MGDLSAHFSSSEFADPATGEAKVDPMLVSALEELRSLCGQAITITSGYRSPAHNQAIGGVGQSEHLVGKAADVKIGNFDTWQLFALAEQVEAFRNGGIGIYPGENFLHVDVRGTRARWLRLGGAYHAVADFFSPP